MASRRIPPSRRAYDPNTSFAYPHMEHEYRMSNLSDSKKVVISINPHPPTMQSLGFRREVENKCREVGLDLEKTMGDMTYACLVVDFISTFEVVKNGGRVSGWRFTLQGVEFIMSREEVIRELGFSDEGIFPLRNDNELFEFWHEIAGGISYNPNRSAKLITSAKWRYMHRLFAINFNTRKDEGCRVSREDLGLMLTFHQGFPMDLFTFFTHRFSGMSKWDSKSKAFGCGALITTIAKSKGFTFDPRHGKAKTLDIPTMRRMKILDETPRNVNEEPEDESLEALLAEIDAYQPEEEASSAAPHERTNFIDLEDSD